MKIGTIFAPFKSVDTVGKTIFPMMLYNVVGFLMAACAAGMGVDFRFWIFLAAVWWPTCFLAAMQMAHGYEKALKQAKLDASSRARPPRDNGSDRTDDR
ncbi:MAG: hypothetical protein F4W95_02790 [Chloroflexi bacterium]|nr:hypothetical protein [Chloroflexota bacterium]MYD47394.1 hypothetical protein [Chloroflexota bacterium]